jgi:FAD/FMN-containing dehydrogenase
MPNQTVIRASNATSWQNEHKTFTQPVNNLFDIYNGDTGNVLFDYNETTKAIQGKMKEAIQQNKKIRALGGGWSWSKVAATDGWIFNTKNLNMTLKIRPDRISDKFTGDIDQLFYAQCGNSIDELNRNLRLKNRSLRTSGASNGQTIAGAISTGTHGAALNFGSTQDFVKGLHIIVGPDKHVWLERESEPIISDSFGLELNTLVIRNDALFNAALVSFGSFGFIHGIMIETEPLYLLETSRILIPFEKPFRKLMETLDFNGSGLPNGSETPHHFQVLLNPYSMDKGAYVTVMYKRPYRNDYTPPVVNASAAGPGADAPSFLGGVIDILPGSIPIIINKLISSSYAPYDKIYGTSGEIFSKTDLRGKVLSTAVTVPLDYVNQVTDILFEVNENKEFFGLFSYRYVKGTKAALGFTKFTQSCIIEFDGVVSGNADSFYQSVWDMLEIKKIPYTFHWGKLNNLNDTRLRNMYGVSRDKWVNARNFLLQTDSIKLFNNDMLHDFGLDEVVVNPVV